MASYTTSASDTASASDAPTRKINGHASPLTTADTYSTIYTTNYQIGPDVAGAADVVTAKRTLSRKPGDTAGTTDAAAGSNRPPINTPRATADTVTAAADSPTVLTALAPVAPTDVGGLHLRAWDIAMRRLLTVIPEIEQATVQDQRNAAGQLSVSVAASSPGAAALLDAPSAIIGLFEQGRPIGLFVYDEDDRDDADAAGPDAEVQLSAPGALSLLTWVALYPQAGFGQPQNVTWQNVTPGKVLLDALAAGQARGTLDGVNGPLVTTSFSATVDSDGTPWPSTVWVQYDAGKTMLDVVTDLANRGYLNVRMRGMTLDAYVGSGSPNTATSVVPTPTSLDAQGWVARSGCTAARDTTDLPTNVAGVTASLKVTGVIGTVAAVQSQLTAAQATYTAATAKLAADVAAVNAADTAAKRTETPAEKAQVNADQAAVLAAQKNVADLTAQLSAAMAATPGVDAVVATTTPYAVVAGATYDAGAVTHAAAVTRAVRVTIEFSDGSGTVLASPVVGALTDSPDGWGAIAGQVTAPAGATQAVMVVRFIGVGNAEVHYVARAVMSPSTGTTADRDLPAVILHRPAYVQSAPRKRQRSAVSSVKLALGEANTSLEVADADAIALYGRREGVSSQGGVSDYPTLERLAQLDLAQTNRPKLGWTVTYARVTGDKRVPVPQPWRDFFVGNKVRCAWIRNTDIDPTSTDTSFASVQVSSITATWDSSGVATAELELDDIFLQRDVALALQVQGLLMGTSAANPTGSTPTPGEDTLAPGPVQAVFVSSSPSLQADGTYVALVTVNWPAVLVNSDGSRFDDLGYYVVDYRIGNYPDETAGWQNAQQTQNTQVGVTAPDQATFQARVLVFDSSGNYPTNADGTPRYAYSATGTLTRDAQAPTAPDAPTVTQLAGGLAVYWDGKDLVGAPMPPDYAKCEFHVSSVSGFTPTPATLAATLFGSVANGVQTVLTPPRLTYGVDYYVRVVAYDSAGNPSQPGVQAAKQRMRLVGPADLDPTALVNTDHSAMFNADATGLGGGSVVADAAARDGNARQLAAGQVASGLAYGTLAPGRYRATWVLRTDAPAATPATPVATVNVTGTGVASDGAATVTTGTVSNGQGYRTASVLFTTTGASVVDLPITNARSSGNVWLSHVYVEPVQSVAVAEIRDAMVADLSATKITAGTMTAAVVLAADAQGNPGRFRVGMTDPVSGLSTAAGFEISATGLRAQGPGGRQTLLIDPTSGQVQIVGSIQAGSSLPGSVYAMNLVQNPSMEDPVPGTVAGTSGVLPLAWTDAFTVAGTASQAYADQGTNVIGGSQSLTIRSDDNASSRRVGSATFPVVPGERLQVMAQFEQNGPVGPVYVGVAFGGSATFFTNTVSATGAVPDNCQVLNLDGSVAATVVGAAVPGATYVLSGWTPLAAGATYKATGSVVVPAGATWARLVIGNGPRTSGSGSTWTTFDNTSVIRSGDGTTMVASTITGPVIQTATSGARVVLTSTSGTGQILVYNASTSFPPVTLGVLTTESQGVGFIGNFSETGMLIQAPPTPSGAITAFRGPGANVALTATHAGFYLGPGSAYGQTTGYLEVRGSNAINGYGFTGSAHPVIGLGFSATASSYGYESPAGNDYLTIDSTAGATFQCPVTINQNVYAALGYIGLGSGGSYADVYSNGNGTGRFRDSVANVGCYLLNSSTGISNGTAGWLEAATYSGGAFTTMKASAFTVSSTYNTKADIEPLDDGWALDVVAAAPAYRWRYIGDLDPDVRSGADMDEWHFGPMWEDVHGDVRTTDEGLDLRDLIGVLWSAVGELSQRVAALTAEKAALPSQA